MKKGDPFIKGEGEMRRELASSLLAQCIGGAMERNAAVAKMMIRLDARSMRCECTGRERIGGEVNCCQGGAGQRSCCGDILARIK